MTLLSQQLQKLSIPREKVASGTIQYSSLIFSRRVASDYDIQDLYDIGVNGIEELVALNPVFAKFEDTLFHTSSVGFERSVKTKDVLEEMDKEIELFLAYVSSYSLLSPAHKALEWLIRAFKIHRYNSEALLYTFLPLHDSKIFAKILEIVDLPENWKWLEVAKRNNVGITKEDLTKLCTSNPQYFIYLLNSAIKVLELTGSTARIHNSFLVTLVVLALERFSEVPSSIIPQLYSSAVTIMCNTHKDVKAAGLIIAAQLVRKVTLKPHAITELLTLMSESADDSLIKELILTLCCVSHYQTIAKFPIAVVHLFLRDRYLSTLVTIAGKSDAKSFLRCLVNSTIELPFSTDLVVHEMMRCLTNEIDLQDDLKMLCCNLYFEQYFLAGGKVNTSASKLGEHLSTKFTKEFQNVFEKYHRSNCDSKVLESIKNIILGDFNDSKLDFNLMESQHSLSGIRMLSLLKISQKLDSNMSITEDEKDEFVSSLLDGLQDEDHAVCLKAIDILKPLCEADDAVYDKVLHGFLQKSVDITSKRNTDPEFVFDLVVRFARFPCKSRFINTFLSLIINLGPKIIGDKNKSLSEVIKKISGQKKLAKIILGHNSEHLYEYIWGLPGINELFGMLISYPSPEHFKCLSLAAINPELSAETKDLLIRYFVSILEAAVDKKVRTAIKLT